jgi:hypothetical protein
MGGGLWLGEDGALERISAGRQWNSAMRLETPACDGLSSAWNVRGRGSNVRGRDLDVRGRGVDVRPGPVSPRVVSTKRAKRAWTLAMARQYLNASRSEAHCLPRAACACGPKRRRDGALVVRHRCTSSKVEKAASSGGGWSSCFHSITIVPRIQWNLAATKARSHRAGCGQWATVWSVASTVRCFQSEHRLRRGLGTCA